MKNLIFIISLIFMLFINVQANNDPRRNASLQGSRHSMSVQIATVRNTGLCRINDKAQLELYISKELLVPINRIENVNIDYRLSESNRFARPNVALFLKNFGAAFFKKFGLYIMVNSAIRTIAGQKDLCKTNSNAAPAMQTSHTTGATVDVAYTDMTDEQLIWTQSYLLGHEARGEIEATMEYTQTVFHIMVLK